MSQVGNARQGPLLLALLVILGCLTYSGFKLSRGAIDTDFMSMIPSHWGDPQAEAVAGLVRNSLERRFLLLINAEDERSAEAIDWLQGAMMEIEQVQLDAADQSYGGQLTDGYAAYRFQLLDAEMRERLAAQSPDALAGQVLSRLYQPGPQMRAFGMDADPFGLGDRWLQARLGARFIPDATGLMRLQTGAGTDPQDWLLLSAQLTTSPYDLDLQAQLDQLLNNFDTRFPGFDYHRSGLVFHALEASQLSRREVSTIGLASLIGVLLLVGMVFRRLRDGLFLLLVIGGSWLAGLTACLLVFPRVHLVTLTFAATLLGLAADYCFHFLVKARTLGSGTLAAQTVFRALVLSALTSALAYAFQYVSPFPGLQQFAVFVATGLLAACALVLLLAPWHIAGPVQAPLPLGLWYNRYLQPGYQWLARQWLPSVLLFTGLVVIAAGGLWQRGSSDDIRQLGSSSEELLASERKVNQWLSGFDAQRFFLSSGDTPDQALESVEALAESLQTQADPAAGERLFAVSDYLPSEDSQRASYDLVARKIYGDQGALQLLCAQLPGDCDWAKPMPPFRLLSVENLPATLAAMHPALPLLQQSLAVAFVRDPAVIQEFNAMSNQPDGVRLVDRVAQLSDLLGQSRRITSWALVGFFGLILVVLIFALRRNRAFMAVPGVLLISGLTSLWIVSTTGISLFHLLALLLVIGISLDTAIFYACLGVNRDTWAASTLACISSLLVFGFLAASQVPVLHQFGSVVFAGLLCTWLVAPLLVLLFQSPETAARSLENNNLKSSVGNNPDE